MRHQRKTMRGARLGGAARHRLVADVVEGLCNSLQWAAIARATNNTLTSYAIAQARGVLRLGREVIVFDVGDAFIGLCASNKAIW